MSKHGTVAVVGAGLAGLSTALHLARLGSFSRIVVLDRASAGTDVSGACASTLNAGIVFVESGDGSIPKASDEEKIFSYLCHGTRDIYQAIQRQGKHNIEFENCGCMLVARTTEEVEELRRDVAHKVAAGLDVKLLSGDEVRQKCSIISKDVLGGLWLPHGATAHPRKTTQALASLCKDFGVEVLSNHTIQSVAKVSNSATSQVAWQISGQQTPAKTKLGSRFTLTADALVIAAGAASHAIAKLISPTASRCVPVIPVVGQMWATAPQPTRDLGFILGAYESRTHWRKIQPLVPPHITHLGLNSPRICRHIYGKQSADGCFLFGGDRRVAIPSLNQDPVLWPHTIQTGIEENRRHVEEIIPPLANLPIHRTWAGLMPFSADGVAIVGKIPDGSDSPPLYACTGFGSDGFMTAPMAGKLLAQLMTSNNAPSVARAADPSRFLRPKSHL